MNTMQRSDLLRSKPFLLSAGCVVGIILLTVFVVIPELSLLNEKRKMVEQKKKQAALIRAKAEELSTMSKSKITSDYQLADRILPSAPDIPSIIESISGLADQSGLSITNLNLTSSVESSPSGQSETAQSVLSTLSLMGPRNGAGNFLQLYEKTYPMFTLENVHITNTTSGVSEFTSVAKSYSQTNPQTIGDVQTPLPILSDAQKTTLASLAGYSQFKPLDTGIASEATESPKRKDPFTF